MVDSRRRLDNRTPEHKSSCRFGQQNTIDVGVGNQFGHLFLEFVAGCSKNMPCRIKDPKFIEKVTL